MEILMKNLNNILQVVASIIFTIAVLVLLSGRLSLGFFLIAIFSGIIGFLMGRMEEEDAAFSPKIIKYLKILFMVPATGILIVAIVSLF